MAKEFYNPENRKPPFGFRLVEIEHYDWAQSEVEIYYVRKYQARHGKFPPAWLVKLVGKIYGD